MFKFIGTKPSAISPKFFSAVLLLLSVVSCTNRKRIPFPVEESGYAQPLSKPFKFSEPQPLKWITVSADSIKPPKSIPFDIDKLPSKSFTINDFKPLKKPVEIKELSWNNIPDSAINLDTIPERPFKLKLSVLPKPKVLKLGMPKLLDNPTAGILHFDESAGLPSASITATLKDQNGIVWIATKDGQLCRYLGENLFIYNFTDNLNNKAITQLAEDNRGNIWVITEGNGIYLVNYGHNILQHDESFVFGLDIVFDKTGNAWIARWGGLITIDTKKNTIKNIIPPGQNEEERSAFSIQKDHYNNIWISHRMGVTVINANRKSAKNLSIKNILNQNRNFNFFEDSNGDMWLENTGANIISIKNNTLSTITPENGPIGWNLFMLQDEMGNFWMSTNDTVFILNKEKTKIKTIVTNANMVDRFRGGMLRDNQGNIWIGSVNKGLLIIDPKGPLPEHLDSKKGLIDDNIWGLFEDKNQNIWISTYKGINIYNSHKNQLKSLTTGQGLGHNRTSRFFESKQGDIFFGSTTGFSVISPQKKSITNYGNEQGIPDGSAPQELLLDSLNRLWLICDKAVEIYDLTKNSLNILNKSTGLLSETFWDIKADRYGNFWTGTDSGIAIINPATNTIRYLGESGGLCSNKVIKIVVRNNGQIAAVTYKGISIIDPAKLTITNLSANEGLVPELQYDLLEKNGKLYAGSKDGIIVITPPDTTDNTNDKKKSWSFINYNKTQGFPFNDYNQNTAITTSNGQSWWGVTPMLTILTKSPEADTVVPTAYISRINIMDQFPSFFSWSSLGKNLNATDTLWNESMEKYFVKSNLPPDSGYLINNDIQWDSLSSIFNIPIGLVLPYNQNYLNFSFVNNDIRGRDKIVYRYVLEGADKKWSDISDRPFSRNYYNLSPGQYTFIVATKGFNGVWSKPVEFSFTIRSPWWMTWWAYILYVLLAAFIISTYARYRSRKLQLENAALENKIKQRTAELSKSLNDLKATQTQLVHAEKMASLGELTAGIAHEIQNPLNFVNNFSDVNKELLSEMKDEMDKGNMDEAKAIANDIIDNEDKINHHGKRADSIVKGMLQHSRSSTGQKELTDINTLAEEYLRLSYHGLRAKDKNFNAILKTGFDKNLDKINIIPQDIGRVLLNLYNNAFYAVKEKSSFNTAAGTADKYEPAVSVTTKKNGGKIEIKVQDNGQGIPQNIVDKIFQPFFTTKPTGQGTGLGLSLSYDIITKGHSGELKVNTTEGEGAEFIILLPA